MNKTLFWSAALLLLAACNREIVVGDAEEDDESADEATDELSQLEDDTAKDDESGLSEAATEKGGDL